MATEPAERGLRLDSGPVVIGEVAQAHDGSLGAAHAYIDAIAAAGAHAVKFQTHIAVAESRLDEPWRVQFSPQDATRYDYWRRMEFSRDQWSALRAHALAKGLGFVTSPFSLEAIDMLESVGGVAAWKVASGEVANMPLLRRLAATDQPVLISSGMSAWEEIDDAVALMQAARAQYAVMQCTSRYPTPPEAVGLNVLPEMKARYDCPVGLSDHSGTIWPSLAGYVLGGTVFEVHVTLSRHGFGPDTVVSLTPEELGDLVSGLDFTHRALANAVDKRTVPADIVTLRTTFGRSIVAARDLQSGTVLAASDITVKKPGGGLPAAAFESVIGRMLQTDLRADESLHEGDLA